MIRCYVDGVEYDLEFKIIEELHERGALIRFGDYFKLNPEHNYTIQDVMVLMRPVKTDNN